VPSACFCFESHLYSDRCFVFLIVYQLVFPQTQTANSHTPLGRAVHRRSIAATRRGEVAWHDVINTGNQFMWILPMATLLLLACILGSFLSSWSVMATLRIYLLLTWLLFPITKFPSTLPPIETFPTAVLLLFALTVISSPPMVLLDSLFAFSTKSVSKLANS
jgi:hypothetical protein